MEILNREGELANWQLKCSDQEKTVNQFRDLVNKLQVFSLTLIEIVFASAASFCKQILILNKRDIAKMKEMAQEENVQINEIVSRYAQLHLYFLSHSSYVLLTIISEKRA
jgi:hypothetical protein